MSVDVLRNKTKEELEGELLRLRKSFSELRIKHRVAGLKDTNVLRKQRKELARIMTILREKEILSGSEDQAPQA